MSEERIGGTFEEMKGAAREAWGRATGQPEQEVRGQIEQMRGQARRWAGRIQDDVSRSVRRVREDPSMQRPETRGAALRLLAYAAGALILINGILMGARRRQ